MDENSDKDAQSILAITSSQLDRCYRHMAIKDVLKDLHSQLKDKPINEQIKYYETQAQNLTNENELIKFYIFICARDSLFNFHEIIKTPNIVKLFMEDGRVYNNISEMNNVVEDEIKKAGGYYPYFRKNRDEIKQRYPLGVPGSVKYKEKSLYLQIATQDYEGALQKARTIEEIEKISEAHRIKVSNPFPENEMKIEKEMDIPYIIELFNRLVDKIEELEQTITDGENMPPSVSGSYSDDDIMQIITWGKSKEEFLRHKALLQKSEISFTPLSIQGKPYFKRGDEAKAAASLFLFWQKNKFINGFIKESKNRKSYNIKIITCAFSMNNENNFKEGALRDALYRINKGDKNKLEVFSDLLLKN